MAEQSRGHDNTDPPAAPPRARVAGEIVALGRIAAKAVRLVPGNDNRRPRSYFIHMALSMLAAFGAAALIFLVFR